MMANLFKKLQEEKKQDEEEKTEEPEFQTVTNLLENAQLTDEDGKSKQVTGADIVKQFIMKIGESRDTQFVTTQMPAFFDRWIQSGVFKASDWTPALSQTIQYLENIASDVPHMISVFAKSALVPLVISKGLVKLSEIVWIDSEESFDTTSQYSQLATVLDEMIKKDGSGAVQTFKKDLGESMEQIKTNFEEGGMMEDFAAYINQHVSADNKDVILEAL